MTCSLDFSPSTISIQYINETTHWAEVDQILYHSTVSI